MIDSLLQTWQIHQRINLYLLESIAEEHLRNVGPSKGRSVGEAFAHLHNVRLMWLEAAAPDFMDGMAKWTKEQSPDKPGLAGSLEVSAIRIEEMVRRSLEQGGRIKGFKPHAVAFVGYLIAHEAHHRGQIILTLKQTGAPVDKKVSYGIWEWGVR